MVANDKSRKQYVYIINHRGFKKITQRSFQYLYEDDPDSARQVVAMSINNILFKDYPYPKTLRRRVEDEKTRVEVLE